MSWYCMVASSVGGFLFSLPLLLDFANLDSENIKQALVLAVFFGGGTGLFQRLFASILLGAAMAIVSRSFFKTVANPWVFKFAMGITTSAIVHLFAPNHLVRFYLSELAEGEYEPLWESVTVIAVYAGAISLSQVMARKYLREISPEAQKEKPE